jgi:hypothetical protein
MKTADNPFEIQSVPNASLEGYRDNNILGTYLTK